jgi:leader peptidase (prepilin peptidase)/N-methyltransferase
MQHIEIAALIFITVLGACLGSFVNAAAQRSVKGESWTRGRSMCPSCGKVLQWFELLPLLSWLLQTGRCRGCKQHIPLRYPLAEALGAGLAALSFLRFGFTWMTPLSLGVCFILLAISLIDYESMEIPNGLVIVLIPLAAAAVWLDPGVTLLQRGIGFFTVSVPLLIAAFVKENAFGGGDIKLMAVCGFLLGWQSVFLAFLIALLTGVCYALAVKKRKNEPFAFGPFLCFGVVIALLYGNGIISAYLRLFGF